MGLGCWGLCDLIAVQKSQYPLSPLGWGEGGRGQGMTKAYSARDITATAILYIHMVALP